MSRPAGTHLHPDAWGHGYASEAAEAVLNDASSRCVVHAVMDPVKPGLPSVCRRLGMTHLGCTTRYYDNAYELFETLAS